MFIFIISRLFNKNTKCMFFKKKKILSPVPRDIFMKKTGCLRIGLIPHQPSAPPAEPTPHPTEMKEYYLEEFNVDLLKSVDFNPT